MINVSIKKSQFENFDFLKPKSESNLGNCDRNYCLYRDFPDGSIQLGNEICLNICPEYKRHWDEWW